MKLIRTKIYKKGQKMQTKQYFMVFSRNQRIFIYRSKYLNHFIENAVDEILGTYGLEPEDITNEDFDSQYFRELYDISKSDAKALKKLFKFRESLPNKTIELNEESDYQFLGPNEKWALIFEQKYGATIITGFTNVEEGSKVSFRIEEI